MMYSKRARALRRDVAPHSPHRPAKIAYVPCACQATATPIGFRVVLLIGGYGAHSMMDGRGRDRGRGSPASTGPLLPSGGQVTLVDVACEDVSDAGLDMLDGLSSIEPVEDPFASIARHAQNVQAQFEAVRRDTACHAQNLQAQLNAAWIWMVVACHAQNLQAPLDTVWLDVARHAHNLQAQLEPVWRDIVRHARNLQAPLVAVRREVEAAFAPGTPNGDLRIVLTPDHPQRTEAIARTAQRVGRKWLLYPPLRRALAAHAREHGMSLSEAKQQEMLVALITAVGEVRRPQGKRLDRYWPKRADGTPLELSGRDRVPLGLSWKRFTRWLIDEVRRQAQRDIRQMQLERPHGALLAELGAAFPLIGGDPETIAAEAEQHREQLERMLRRASPRQRDLLRLLDDGFTLTESAALLGIEPSTARVQLHRLRRAIAM